MRTARGALLLACGLVQSSFVHPIIAAQRPGPGIDQTSFVSVGSIDQWISIQGLDRSNPVLLVVHGGPGESQWPVADKYVPWQRHSPSSSGTNAVQATRTGRYGARTPEFSLDRIASDG